MSWPEAIVTCVGIICAAPVVTIWVIAITGFEIKWRRKP